jgi:hypothetical protein
MGSFVLQGGWGLLREGGYEGERVGRGAAKELLKISAREQDFEQAGTLEVGERFTAEGNEQSAVCALIEKGKGRAEFSRRERAPAYDFFQLIEPLVAGREEVIETKVLSPDANDRGLRATTCLARRAYDWGGHGLFTHRVRYTAELSLHKSFPALRRSYETVVMKRQIDTAPFSRRDWFKAEEARREK